MRRVDFPPGFISLKSRFIAQFAWSHAARSAHCQNVAVAKLIQRIDNSLQQRPPAVASLSLLHLSPRQFGKVTFAVPRQPRSRAASEGEDFYEARFPSAPAHDHASCRRQRRSPRPPLRRSTPSTAPTRIRRQLPAPPTRSPDRRLRRKAADVRRPTRRARRSARSQDIVVTGTRIPQPNLTSASPVTVLSNQEVKLSGHDPHRRPDQLAAAGVRRAGFGRFERRDRHREVNLRGLGSKRTLVLINGRRCSRAIRTAPARPPTSTSSRRR